MADSNILLFIDGAWCRGAAGATLPTINPANGETIGSVARAEPADLDRALAAAEKGFKAWRKVSAYDRGRVLRKAAELMRARADAIAAVLTREQGKPLAEAKGEAWQRRRHSSIGSPRRRGAPMGAWSRRAPIACSRSW